MDDRPEDGAAEPRAEQVLAALRRIMREAEVHSRQMVQQCGLSGPQLLVLRELDRAGGLGAGDLAASISVSQATISGILDRLERRGLVRRRRSEADRRRVVVQHTPRGRSLLDEAPPAMSDAFAERFSELADWEQHLILASLERLAAMMQTAGDASRRGPSSFDAA
ncbi:MAG: MarR family winged helix-turn-helix transcriptional regulator [Phycisphaeraceae bacterium]